jgi:hypothetical protein
MQHGRDGGPRMLWNSEETTVSFKLCRNRCAFASETLNRGTGHKRQDSNAKNQPAGEPRHEPQGCSHPRARSPKLRVQVQGYRGGREGRRSVERRVVDIAPEVVVARVRGDSTLRVRGGLEHRTLRLAALAPARRRRRCGARGGARRGAGGVGRGAGGVGRGAGMRLDSGA